MVTFRFTVAVRIDPSRIDTSRVIEQALSWGLYHDLLVNEIQSNLESLDGVVEVKIHDQEKEAKECRDVKEGPHASQANHPAIV